MGAGSELTDIADGIDSGGITRAVLFGQRIVARGLVEIAGALPVDGCAFRRQPHIIVIETGEVETGEGGFQSGVRGQAVGVEGKAGHVDGDAFAVGGHQIGLFAKDMADLVERPAQRGARIVGNVEEQLAQTLAAGWLSGEQQIREERPRLSRRGQRAKARCLAKAQTHRATVRRLPRGRASRDSPFGTQITTQVQQNTTLVQTLAQTRCGLKHLSQEKTKKEKTMLNKDNAVGEIVEAVASFSVIALLFMMIPQIVFI